MNKNVQRNIILGLADSLKSGKYSCSQMEVLLFKVCEQPFDAIQVTLAMKIGKYYNTIFPFLVTWVNKSRIGGAVED